MSHTRFLVKLAIVMATALAGTATLAQQDVKIADPTSVVMIVNRDSNDLAFMDIKTTKIIGRVFLGNNVNPHMVMMSPRSEEHTSELQSRFDLVCRLLLEKKNKQTTRIFSLTVMISSTIP